MAKLTKDELSKIAEILSPLDKDPIKYETLNPMSRVLRKIKGLPEIITEEETKSAVEEEPIDGGIELPEDAISDLSEPPKMKYFDESDVDIDELLNDASSLMAGQPIASKKDKEPEPEQIQETDFDQNSNFEDTTEDPFGSMDTATSEDPFGAINDEAVDTTQEIQDSDPFAFDETPQTTSDSISTNEDDPFAGFGEDETSTPDISSEQIEDPFADAADAFEKSSAPNAMDTDPFADVVPTNSFDSDDPFADLDTPTATNVTEDDPFAMDDSATIQNDTQPTSDDPFAGFDEDTNTDTNDNDFTSSQPEAADDPFANFDSEPNAADDPFGDLGADSDSFGDSNDLAGFEDTNSVDTFDTNDSSTTMEPMPMDDYDSSGFESTDDPFADIQPSTGIGHDFDAVDSGQDYESSFDDLGAGIGDVGGNTNSSLDVIDEIGPSSETGSYESLDEDLDSLAQEEEPEEDLSDEELAVIQQEILKYPPKLKRTVIDVITNEKLHKAEQRELIEIIKASQKPEDIAAYLTEKLGYEVELFDKSGLYSERGIPVISTKPIYTKEGELRRRELIKRTVLIAAASILGVIGLISTYKYVIRPFQAARHYKEGIEYIKKAGLAKDKTERTQALLDAKTSFSKGEKIEPNNLEYLNKYGMAYNKIGEYDQAFEKLFGVVEPDFGAEKNGESESWTKRLEVPYIQLSSKTTWDNDKLPLGGRKEVPDNELMVLVSGSPKKQVERKIRRAGAYIVARLEKNIHDNQTYINLGKFHSNIANLFNKPAITATRNYKNDNLAVNYFKEVFTDGEDENNVEATAGLAKVYYNQKNFAKSVFYYNKIVEKFPSNAIGHGGLLSNYIEMWKGDQNPQFVLNHHRQVRNSLNIEDDLSLFVLAKLASFYIDLDASEVRIKYNINPEDQVTNMDLEDNVEHLLNLAFFKTEKGEDGEDVKGDEFAEGYYQRGRFLINKGESIRALKQFEFAASYDPAHYLAVMEMAEHYMRVNNYSESIDLLQNAKKRYEAYKDLYGNREEDETLLNGDPGRIFFDEGKIVFMESSLISKDGKISEFPDRKVYPDKSLSQLSEEESNRRRNLNNAMQKFDIALKLNLKDSKLKRELYYYKGWIEYMRSDYEAALNEWSNLSEEDTYRNSNVMIGRANAFYNLDQLNASLGNYIKLKEDFEEKESLIARPTPDESAHQEIYNILIAVYNNIGAVYERKGNSAQALKHYWKAIEIARKIGLTTEIANYNKDMVFKAKPGGALPLLDDWLSPTIDTVKELQNTKKAKL
ncbi:MAG TPA: hypothetical protein PK079_10525 [Leptospiraceae bacterium]|nr:hypothetical protein [Leptospiraceae bacterium]HMX30730.1 hypothetical protein [Leptospiraceae bacterium]HMY31803.1 hypothetical protein [Leptospiraceae bacterium]HMZ63134.1 hypothetical protein [Leptospiraceae bacterium]HNA07742.1 hypothetical protein [Leptospiraceae bacterium]